MKYVTRTSALIAAILFTAASAHAQAGAGAASTAGTPDRRAAAQERRAEARENLKNMTPEERKAALAQAKERREERRENLTPEQRAWAQALATESKRIQDGVKGGTLTRESAAAQLKAWREANARPKGNGGF